MSTSLLAPSVVTIEIEGVLTTSLVGKVALPFNGTITGAMAVVSTSATGSALNFTLVNGAVNAGQFSIAAGAEVDAATLTPANCKFNAGDIIAVTISQIGSSYAGKDLTVEYILKIGAEHFDAYDIHAMEVDGFVDYIRRLDVLILQVHAANGDLILTDVSMLLPERDQVYGSFCQWNTDYKKHSPGIYGCVLAARWAARNGYKYYNLGPVGDYGYKSLLVTDLEPIYGIAMTDPDHALALDPSSPLHTDFNPAQWNQIYRRPTD